MGSKKTTNTTYQDTQTAAPPSWTMPGIEDTAGRVTDALSTLPGERYTGQFTAQPNQALIDQITQSYLQTGSQAGMASNLLAGNAAWLADYSPDWGGDPFTGMNIPTAPGANASLEQLMQLGGQAMLDKPDFQSMLPTLAAGPQYREWTPDQFEFGNGEDRLNNALSSAIQPVMRQLTNDVLPGLRSSAIEAGAYSGDRAMGVIPSDTVAEFGRRASEITQQLAYEGYQAEEARRLAQWQTEQEMLGGENARFNDFGFNTWAQSNQDAISLYNTLVGAESNAFNTQQGAANSMFGTAADFMLGLDGQALDRWNAEGNMRLAEGQLRNDTFSRMTERGSAEIDAISKAMGVQSDQLMQALQMSGSQGDLLAQILQMQMGADQAGIDNALAQDQYNLQYPFRGLDIATALLGQLSGNWGTTDRSGSSRTVEKTGGMGSVVQGLAGLGMMGASVFGGGGLGSALGAAGGAGGAAANGASNLFRNFGGLNWS